MQKLVALEARETLRANREAMRRTRMVDQLVEKAQPLYLYATALLAL